MIERAMEFFFLKIMPVILFVIIVVVLISFGVVIYKEFTGPPDPKDGEHRTHVVLERCLRHETSTGTGVGPNLGGKGGVSVVVTSHTICTKKQQVVVEEVFRLGRWEILKVSLEE